MFQLLVLVNVLVIVLSFSNGINCVADGQNENNDELNVVEPENEPLMLTPLINAGKIKDAQKAAEVVEIKEMPNTKSYSGYITVNATCDANLFFWFFPSQNDYENAPLILWLQGGPGRSSLRGLLMENGPFNIEKDTLVRRNATWTQDHSVIYLDNPVGAGFSYGDDEAYHMTLAGIAKDLYNAILQFFQLFPSLQKNDFYIAGQSYGGKYVPAIAHMIYKKNPEAKQKINLVGIAIGNGLVDPETQLRYSEYLYQIGLINFKGKTIIEAHEKKMLQEIKEKQWKSAYITYTQIILNARDSMFKRLTGFSNTVNFLEQFSSIEKEIYMSRFVSKPAIRKAIHAGNNSYYPNSGLIQFLLRDDLMRTVAPLLSELIDNYKVLIYNGQLDIIIPYRTTTDYLRKLTFKGVENYDNAERQKWYVNNTLAGYVTQVGNLTEVMVRNAGHSVPEDQIIWATDMLYRFTRNQSFITLNNNSTSVRYIII